PGAGQAGGVHPAEGLEPHTLRVRALGAVVVALLLLAPVPVVGQPLVGAALDGVGGDELGPGHDAAQRLGGVVAAQSGAALPGLEPDRRAEEGRVRARGRIDDRVRPLLLHALVVPVRGLATAVLEQADLVRAVPQRLLRRRTVEGDLHALPVALVQVVELVEVPEEPVLDDQAVGARLAGQPRVRDRRGLARLLERGEVARVAAVVADRVAGKVEVVGVVKAGDPGRGGAVSDDALLLALDLLKHDPGIAEHRVDRGRLVLLLALVAGRVFLLADLEDGRVAGDELLSRGRRRLRGLHRDEERKQGQQQASEARAPQAASVFGAPADPGRPGGTGPR